MDAVDTASDDDGNYENNILDVRNVHNGYEFQLDRVARQMTAAGELGIPRDAVASSKRAQHLHYAHKKANTVRRLQRILTLRAGTSLDSARSRRSLAERQPQEDLQAEANDPALSAASTSSIGLKSVQTTSPGGIPSPTPTFASSSEASEDIKVINPSPDDFVDISQQCPGVVSVPMQEPALGATQMGASPRVGATDRPPSNFPNPQSWDSSAFPGMPACNHVPTAQAHGLPPPTSCNEQEPRHSRCAESIQRQYPAFQLSMQLPLRSHVQPPVPPPPVQPSAQPSFLPAQSPPSAPSHPAFGAQSVALCPTSDQHAISSGGCSVAPADMPQASGLHATEGMASSMLAAGEAPSPAWTAVRSHGDPSAGQASPLSAFSAVSSGGLQASSAGVGWPPKGQEHVPPFLEQQQQQQQQVPPLHHQLQFERCYGSQQPCLTPPPPLPQQQQQLEYFHNGPQHQNQHQVSLILQPGGATPALLQQLPLPLHGPSALQQLLLQGPLPPLLQMEAQHHLWYQNQHQLMHQQPHWPLQSVGGMGGAFLPGLGNMAPPGKWVPMQPPQPQPVQQQRDQGAHCPPPLSPPQPNGCSDLHLRCLPPGVQHAPMTPPKLCAQNAPRHLAPTPPQQQQEHPQQGQKQPPHPVGLPDQQCRPPPLPLSFTGYHVPPPPPNLLPGFIPPTPMNMLMSLRQNPAALGAHGPLPGPPGRGVLGALHGQGPLTAAAAAAPVATWTSASEASGQAASPDPSREPPGQCPVGVPQEIDDLPHKQQQALADVARRRYEEEQQQQPQGWGLHQELHPPLPGSPTFPQTPSLSSAQPRAAGLSKGQPCGPVSWAPPSAPLPDGQHEAPSDDSRNFPSPRSVQPGGPGCQPGQVRLQMQVQVQQVETSAVQPPGQQQRAEEEEEPQSRPSLQHEGRLQDGGCCSKDDEAPSRESETGRSKRSTRRRGGRSVQKKKRQAMGCPRVDPQVTPADPPAGHRGAAGPVEVGDAKAASWAAIEAPRGTLTGLPSAAAVPSTTRHNSAARPIAKPAAPGSGPGLPACTGAASTAAAAAAVHGPVRAPAAQPPRAEAGAPSRASGGLGAPPAPGMSQPRYILVPSKTRSSRAEPAGRGRTRGQEPVAGLVPEGR